MQPTIILGNKETIRRMALAYCSYAEEAVCIIDALHLIKEIEGTAIMAPNDFKQLCHSVKMLRRTKHLLILGFDAYDHESTDKYEHTALVYATLEMLQHLSHTCKITIALLHRRSLERVAAHFTSPRII